MDKLIPPEGIVRVNGNLFHHEFPFSYTEKAHQRLEEAGIKSRVQKKFTLEETCILLKNWKHFAEKVDYPVTDALTYLGVIKESEQEHRRIIKHRKDYNFYAELCRGLPHRNALVVLNRAKATFTDEFLKTHDKWDDEEYFRKIVHKSFFDIEANRVTDETKKEVLKMKESGYSDRDISTKLDIRLRQVSTVYDRHNFLEDSSKSAKFQIIWSFLTKYEFKAKSFRKALEKGEDDNFETIGKQIDFDNIAAKTTLSVETLKETWDSLVRKSRKTHEKLLENHKPREAAELTISELLDRDFLSFEERTKLLEVACKVVNKNAMVFKNSETIDTETFREKFKECSISKVRRKAHKNSIHLNLNYVSKTLQKFDTILFDKLVKGFTVREKLHCLVWGLNKKSKRWHGLSTEEIVEKSPNLTKTTKHFLQNPVTREWLTERTKNNYMGYSVEAFVIYCSYKYPDSFVFPTKLHHLICSDNVEKLLTKEKNNSDYLKWKQIEVPTLDGSLGSTLMRKFVHKEKITRDTENEDEPSAKKRKEI